MVCAVLDFQDTENYENLQIYRVICIIVISRVTCQENLRPSAPAPAPAPSRHPGPWTMVVGSRSFEVEVKAKKAKANKRRR
jgi:hypothetical protein